MKNWLFLFSFIFIFSLATISAVTINLVKSEYYSGETLQAEISGGFVDSLLDSNIGIYKEGAVHKSPTGDSGIVKDETKYYYYALLPQEPGKYSLRIENTKHYENNNATTATIEKNFTITETNSSYLSFSPGYIKTTTDFKIIVKSYNEEQNIKVEFPLKDFEQNFSLGYGFSKNIYLSISGLTGVSRDSIKINSYTLPVIVVMNDSSSTNDSSIIDRYNLSDIIEVDPRGLNILLPKNKENIFPIDIRNTRQEFYNIELTTSDKELKIEPEEIIGFNGTQRINLTISSNRSFNGYIKISHGDNSLRIPINLEVSDNASAFNSTPVEVNPSKTCSDLGGKICNYESGEECDKITYDANNKACCLSGCMGKKTSYGWLWGLLLLIVLGVGVWYFLKKAKKSPDEKSTLTKRVEDYKKRMDLDENLEVRKGLVKE